MLRRQTNLRSLAALALLGVMCLGSACHFWHHLVDPDCAVAGQHGAQPCAACSALHSGAIATEPEMSAPPHLAVVAQLPPAEIQESAAPVVPGGAPRAPPAA